MITTKPKTNGEPIMLREFYDDFPTFDVVRDIIIDGAERGGSKRQFVFKDKNKKEHEKSFKEVFEDECALGAYIRSQGVDSGLKVAILSENCYMWNVIFYTLQVNCDICIPLDTGLSKEDIAAQLSDCTAHVLFYSSAQTEKAEYVKNICSESLKLVFCVDECEKFIEAGKSLPDSYRNELLNQSTSPESLAAIVYTSGTTGKTKGIMLSNKNICSDVNASLHAITGGHGIGFLPLNHTYSWVTGLFASLVRSEWGYICTSLKSIYSDIKEYKPYQFAAVPMMVEMIYKHIISTAKRNGTYEKLMSGIECSRNFMLSGYDARREMFSDIHEAFGGNLEYILCGGAYLSPDIEQFMYDIGIQIITGYGLTECSPCVTCSRRYDYKIGSVGLVLDCCEIKIADPDENGIGEICVKGDNVMMGYYGDEKATEEVFNDGWLHTGDCGYIDSEGFLFFIGRKKNLIILSNGKNVSPEEIEAKLTAEIDYIKEVAVCEKDNKICAYVYLDEAARPDAKDTIYEDIKAVNRLLSDFKRIDKVIIRDTEFIKTTSLKIKRQEIEN